MRRLGVPRRTLAITAANSLSAAAQGQNYAEAALMRGIADTAQGSGLLRAHAVRTTVNQAALFGSP